MLGTARRPEDTDQAERSAKLLRRPGGDPAERTLSSPFVDFSAKCQIVLEPTELRSTAPRRC
jgi:hypothetical protein